MGHDFYQRSPEARAVFDQADAQLAFALSSLCFNGPEEQLTDTVNQQPALFVTSMAAWQTMKVRGWEPPAFMAGHSLGEFSALVAAGFFEYTDALLIVRRRGELMYEAGLEVPGTMAAIIGLGEEEVRRCVKDAASEGIVVIANLNSLEQFAVSGEVAAVEKSIELAKDAGAKRAIKLQVSGAFHSPLMAGTSDALTSYIKRFKHGTLDVTWIANVTGAAVQNVDEVVALLSRQLSSPVQWVKSMHSLTERCRGPVLEVGPGKVLGGLMKRIIADVSVHSLSDVAGLRQAVETGG